MARTHVHRGVVPFVALLAMAVVFWSAPGLAQQRTAGDANALAEAGNQALEERLYADALEAFVKASQLATRDAGIAFGVGYSAYLLGRFSEARPWLERALSLNPRYSAAALILGQVLYREGRLSEAIRLYEDAQRATPDDETIRRQLAEWRKEAAISERFFEAPGAHFSVRFEGPADDIAARRIVDILEEAYWRIGGTLSAYPSGKITVVLYTREQFRDITRSPNWASAMYDGRIKIPSAGATQSSELTRILHHEFVHALVAELGGRSVPAWLNEGLATALEPGGLDWATRVLAQTRERVPLTSLERGFARLPGDQIALAYAQSARAVKRIMDLRGVPSVVSLLSALAGGAPVERALEQTVFMTFSEFAAMMARE